MTEFIKTSLFFFRCYRKKTVVVVLLLFMAGIAEAIGIAAFLPFLQIVLEGKATLNHIPEGVLRDTILNSGVPINFLTVGSFIASAIILKAFILWLALVKVGRAVAYISADLRRRFMEALLHASQSFFVQHMIGTSLNAAVMETFRSSMAFLFTARFLSAIVQLLVYSVSACLLSWKVFIGTVVLGSVLVLSLWFLVRVSQKAGQKQTVLAKEMLAQMADMLQGIKPLRAMALENKFMDILLRHSAGLEKAQAEQLVSTQSMKVLYEPLMVVTAIIGLFLAVEYGGLSGSELALMAVIFIRLLGSMNNVQAEYQKLTVQESALWSLLDIVEETEAAHDNWPGSQNVPENIETIRFEGVSFSYGTKKVIKNADIRFMAREMTVLIGESGSGKTSILDLLSGFYTPETGSILVNDKNLCDLDLRKWRKMLGFVPQEVFLFNDSIFENIKIGRDEISEGDVWAALESAGAKEFVEALPDTLHSSVGEGGRMLSGGQRQRIAIARAIVHKPQFLFLDEATSALDSESGQRLLETLQNLAKNITVIFVSHHRNTQNYADRVYKVTDGKVKEVRKKI